MDKLCACPRCGELNNTTGRLYSLLEKGKDKMARKNKTQTAVEEFEAVFGDIVKEYFCDVDMDKAEEYFSNPALSEAICNALDEDEDENEGEENGD